MKSTVSEQKSESSVKDGLRKCKQTSNLLLISSHLTKKSMTKNSNVYAVLNLNESNILQVYFAKTTRTVLGISLFNFSFELWRRLLLLSQEAVIPKFLDLRNLNFQSLCELISLLVQQNLGCFLIHTYVVYLVESIS